MKTIVEILIDNSNSMGKGKDFKESFLLPDGSTRMELVKRILNAQIIPSLNYASRINVKTFHSGEKNELKSLPIFNRSFDEIALREVINDLAIPKNTGGTPITAAVKESIENLKKYDNYDRKIILMTDGEETDGGNYQVAAEEALKLHGIPCEIFVIGIAQNDKASKKAKDLAKATKGVYVNIKAKTYTHENLSTKFHKFESQLQLGTLDKNGAQVSTQISLDSKPIPNQKTTKVDRNWKKATIATLPEVTTKKEPLKEVPNNGTKQVTNKKIVKLKKQLKKDLELEQINDTSNISETKQNSKAIDVLAKSVIQLQQELQVMKANSIDIQEGENNVVQEIEEDVLIEENKELNDKVGKTSEKFVDTQLRIKLHQYKLVHKWMNQDVESGQSYDFEIRNGDTNDFHYYVECKGTMHSEKVFYLTKKEWELVVKNPNIYRIYLVTEALSENPKLTIIYNLMIAIIKGRVVPYATKHIKIKKERIVFTVLD